MMMNASLTMAAALVGALAAGELSAAPKKSPKPDVGPGRVAWFDLTTTDLARSKDFYGKLFAWQFAPVAGTDQAVEIVSNGLSVGTIRVAEGKIGAFNGVVYVQVDDMPSACRKTGELGGTVVPGFPFNLPDGAGAVAVVVDPSGHPIGLYSRTPLPAAPSGKK
jgi:uncharacterized protein